MSIYFGLLNLLLFSHPALALVDSQKNFPTTIPGWTITSHHMDTGDLRRCSAEGRFGDLSVVLGNPFGPKTMEINFRYVKGGAAPGPENPGDYKQGCGSGENKAPSGTWRYNPTLSAEEFCAGSRWLKPTEAHFRKAALLLNGNEIATTEDGAHFKAGSISGERTFFEYSAWFQRVDGLEGKLAKPGKVELRIEGLNSGPIALGPLHLDRAIAEIVRCRRERK